MPISFKRFSDWPIPIKIIISFAVVILLGSVVLAMPFSQLESSQATYFDHLFSAVSMVAVTGLFTEPLAYTYNIFGQFVALFLIKLGGHKRLKKNLMENFSVLIGLGFLNRMSRMTHICML